MSRQQARVVILTSRGPRHSFFAHALARCHQVAGIVLDDRYHFADRLWNFVRHNAWNPARMVQSLMLKKCLTHYERRDAELELKYFSQEAPGSEFPEGVPLLVSGNPNSDRTRQWIGELDPEVIAVFGTRMIRAPLLALGRLGALNLHTGLSPFYRGGQCTFWCLYEEDLEHIGVTVHHLNQRIDGGDIVYTAKPNLEPGDTVRSLECKLVRLGTEKMVDAIYGLKEGNAPRIPQQAKGKLCLSMMFTLEKRLELERRLDSGWLAKRLEERLQKGVPA